MKRSASKKAVVTRAARVSWLAPVLLPALPVLLVLCSCLSRGSDNAPSPAASPSAVAASFVGNDACKQCHESEFAAHGKSRHALTLRPVTSSALGALAPKPGSVGMEGIEFVKQGDRFGFAQPRFSDQVGIADLAIGSGKTGMTFAVLVGDDKLAEIRRSYFPRDKTWYTTPGQGNLAPDDLARLHAEPMARRCLLCHAVTLPEHTLRPEPRFFGVGCESCHGPGSAHIAAVNAGAANLLMEKLSQRDGTKLNEVCGKCHGTVQEAQASHTPMETTNRLQAFGLAQSECFKQSQGALSCVTCHNPHENARTEQVHYEKACVSCHSGAKPAVKICPVNPKTNCVRCHMPSRQAISSTMIPTTMADHYIRVYKNLK